MRYEGLREMTVEVSRDKGRKPKIATFMGTKFATSTQLSARILQMFAQGDWPQLPRHTADWLALQRAVSRLPRAGRLLIESFPHDGRDHACVYGFAGRNAQQTLGLLLTKRMEELGLAPLGFVASDYATLIWGWSRWRIPRRCSTRRPARRAGGVAGGQRGDETHLSRQRHHRRADRAQHPGGPAQDRAAGHVSSDILYDTLQKYDPHHLMLRITRTEAERGLVDFGRIEEMLDRIGGRIDHMRLARITPLAAPLLLEVGKVPVAGQAEERLMAEEAARLMQASGLAELQEAEAERSLPSRG